MMRPFSAHIAALLTMIVLTSSLAGCIFSEEEPDVEELDGDGLEDGEQDEERVDDSSNKEISDEKTSAESGSDE